MTAARDQMLRDRWEQCLRNDPRITRSSLLVLMLMATYGDRDGTRISVGIERICTDTGLGEATVRKAIKAGTRTKYLARDMRGHRLGDGSARSSEYHLTVPFPVTSTRSPVTVDESSMRLARPVDTVSTVKTSDLNRQSVTAQPLRTDGLPGVTRSYQESRGPCGHCDPQRMILDPETFLPVAHCPRCHPRAVKASA